MFGDHLITSNLYRLEYVYFYRTFYYSFSAAPNENFTFNQATFAQSLFCVKLQSYIFRRKTNKWKRVFFDISSYYTSSYPEKIRVVLHAISHMRTTTEKLGINIRFTDMDKYREKIISIIRNGKVTKEVEVVIVGTFGMSHDDKLKLYCSDIAQVCIEENLELVVR